MLIILNKDTGTILNNYGTNSLFPDGNLPIEEKESEIYVRIHDDSAFAKQIMTAYDYELVLDGDNRVVDVIVHKTLSEYQAEQEAEPQEPEPSEIDLLKNEIEELKTTIDTILGVE